MSTPPNDGKTRPWNPQEVSGAIHAALSALDARITALGKQYEALRDELKGKTVHDPRVVPPSDALSLKHEVAELRRARDEDREAHVLLRAEVRDIQARLHGMPSSWPYVHSGTRMSDELMEQIRNDHTTLMAVMGRVATLEERTRPVAHDIGWAVEQLKAGRRVRRKGWLVELHRRLEAEFEARRVKAERP